MPEAAKDRMTILRKTPLFAELAGNELTSINQRVVSKKFNAGEMIFSEGDPCPGLWVVESGQVRIFKSAASGREQVLALEGPGSSVAELPVFDGGNYPASAAAVIDSTLLFVSKEDFRLLCLKQPEVALKVLRVAGRRLRRLVGIIEELSFSTVRHRLVSLLLGLARQAERTPRGIIQVTLPASQQELASQIGTVRELVSRGLSRLQAGGMIQIAGRKITILDLKALEKELEESD
ncbi:MAG: Crp/Fnr family transcriptional regulator [Terriglobia bacterium]